MSAYQDHCDDQWSWVGSIETASGIRYNVMDPDWRNVVLSDVATSLSHICRFGGHVPTFYSVAEHCVRVAVTLADHGPEMMMTGLLHDAAEAYVGDMVRPLKLTGELGKLHQEVEYRNAEAVHDCLGGIFPYPDEIHEADQLTYEWEVENIRTGGQPGWPSHFAASSYVQVYNAIQAEM